MPSRAKRQRCTGYNQRFSIQYIFLKPTIKNTWKNAEKIIPNSIGLKELAQEKLNIKMDLISNGINMNKFQPLSKDKPKPSQEI